MGRLPTRKLACQQAHAHQSVLKVLYYTPTNDGLEVG